MSDALSSGRTRGVLGLAAILAFAVGAAVLVRRSSHAPAAAGLSRATLKVAVPTDCYAAPVALAQARGLFDDAGLDVQLIAFPIGRAAFGALLAGEADLAVVGDIPVAATSLARTDFAVVAQMATGSFDRWVVASAGITNAADLRGKRVATQLRSGAHYVLERLLADASLSPSDVDLVDMPAEEMPGALHAQRVDAFEVQYPYAQPTMDKFGAGTHDLVDPRAYHPKALLVARAKALATPAKHDAILRFVGEVAVAEDAWRAERARAEGDAARELLQDPSAFAAACGILSFDLGLTDGLKTSLRDEAAWFSKHGSEYGKPPPNVDALVDPSALKALRPDTVHLSP